MADNNLTLHLNGETISISSSPDTPLLYVLLDELSHTGGPRFGCGLAQCGACSVLLDGIEVRACVTSVGSVGNREVTTLEGLPAWYAARHEGQNPERLTPLQEALIETQAPQCGYCINGFIIKATELLENNPAPNDDEIRIALNGHLCRCGIYPTLLAAIRQAAAENQEGELFHEA